MELLITSPRPGGTKNIIFSHFALLLLLLFFISVIRLGSAGRFHHKIEEDASLGQNRSAKWFPLFSIVKIPNHACTPEAVGVTGTCFTNKQCTSAKGIVSGTCANGFGVCCVVTATCDSSITQNNTNFRSKDFPQSFTPSGLEVCNTRIQRPSSRICQVRLDFGSMNLAPPDMEGQCMTDRLSINGATGPIPSNLCGDLSGQHMYLDYGSSDRITLSVITDGAGGALARDWNTRITYIECNSLARAPDGCLQYHMSATGSARILGYPQAPHLADLDYTICVRPEDGAGSIVWTPCQGEPIGNSFLMTGAARMDDTGMPGMMCNDDYILIMTDDTSAMTPKTDDRYCGNALTAMPPFMVRSVAKPFIMRVKTNEKEEDTDMMNTGFCLSWRQEPPRPR